MRSKNDSVSIRISRSVYDRLKEDRDIFEKLIGCGVWSLSDTLKEWIKLLDNIKKDINNKKCSYMYSRSMDQEFTRKCTKCGEKEK